MSTRAKIVIRKNRREEVFCMSKDANISNVIETMKNYKKTGAFKKEDNISADIDYENFDYIYEYKNKELDVYLVNYNQGSFVPSFIESIKI